MTDGPSWTRRWPLVVVASAGGWAVCWALVLLLDASDQGMNSEEQLIPGVVGLLCAFMLGAASPFRKALLIGALIGAGLLLIPRPRDPEQLALEAAGGCDPFCDTGGSLVEAFGPFVLLLLPFFLIPVLTGSLVRITCFTGLGVAADASAAARSGATSTRTDRADNLGRHVKDRRSARGR